MTLKGKKIGFALTGSFCTFDKVIKEMEKLVAAGAIVYPILSFNSQTINSRFGKADDFRARIIEITGNDPITTIQTAEPIGPKGFLDIVIIAPCTGNTLAKLANGITDTPVLMAAKAHIRNLKPLVIAVSTNDALGMNLKNLGYLMPSKNIYFVPFGQDDYIKKPNSMVAKIELIPETLEQALDGIQIQPVVQSPF